MHPVGLRLDHVVLLKCNDRLRRLYENKLIYVPRQYFCGFVDFLMTDVYIFFFSLYMYFCQWNFFGFWARRHFHRFYRNLQGLQVKGSLYFNADPFLSVFLIKRLFFFAINFGFEAILFGVFRPKKNLLHNWWRGRLLGLSVSFWLRQGALSHSVLICQ